jgi:hypothetical protein
MKRIGIFALACTTVLSWMSVRTAFATPSVNGATIETRTFNDCPLSTVTTTNNYPSLIQITDAMDPLCVGFANLHSFSFSSDGGTTAAEFDNDANFHFGADFKIEGAGEGEGGLRISPWYGQFVDGRMMANATTGEIACFGGALPFYSFTVNHGITYTRGTTIHMEATYIANDLTATHPASIQYRVVYNGNTYDSPVLPFGEQNELECVHGLWGMLLNGRVGGYFQPRANTGKSLTASWANITYQALPPVGTPVANAATIETRTFNDCPLSTLTTSNNYPSQIQITDVMDPLCVGFANLHSWSFSENGGTSPAEFDDNANFHFGADFKIEGDGEGEGGLRISPWYGQFVDGRMMANATTGEIACFGGALPFYSFTVNHGITYTRGTTIHMEATYRANDLSPTHPASIQYRMVYNGNTYDSPVLPFGEQNETECIHGLWGMLNDGRVGGYFQPRANTGKSLTATWGNITYSPCSENVSFALMPSTLNSNSKGKWITAVLQPTPPSSPSDIDISSIELDGTVAVASGAPTSIGDANGDGIPDLSVKFSRFALLSTLSGTGSQTISITGLIGGQCFEATQSVTVLAAPPLASPAEGSVLTPGTVAQIQWPTSSASTVDLIETLDGGSTWSVIASDVPNTGTYDWTVPSLGSNQVRVGVVEIAFVDPSGGIVTDSEFRESGTFTIVSATGVGGVSLGFGLRNVWPTPARGAFSVSFALPSAEHATLTLFDVVGRQVLTRDVGSMGAGFHTIKIGDKETVQPGLYIVRLTQAGKSQTGRALVVQ